MYVYNLYSSVRTGSRHVRAHAFAHAHAQECVLIENDVYLWCILQCTMSLIISEH